MGPSKNRRERGGQGERECVRGGHAAGPTTAFCWLMQAQEVSHGRGGGEARGGGEVLLGATGKQGDWSWWIRWISYLCLLGNVGARRRSDSVQESQTFVLEMPKWPVLTSCCLGQAAVPLDSLSPQFHTIWCGFPVKLHAYLLAMLHDEQHLEIIAQ